MARTRTAQDPPGTSTIQAVRERRAALATSDHNPQAPQTPVAFSPNPPASQATTKAPPPKISTPKESTRTKKATKAPQETQASTSLPPSPANATQQAAHVSTPVGTVPTTTGTTTRVAQQATTSFTPSVIDLTREAAPPVRIPFHVWLESVTPQDDLVGRARLESEWDEARFPPEATPMVFHRYWDIFLENRRLATQVQAGARGGAIPGTTSTTEVNTKGKGTDKGKKGTDTKTSAKKKTDRKADRRLGKKRARSNSSSSSSSSHSSSSSSTKSSSSSSSGRSSGNSSVNSSFSPGSSAASSAESAYSSKPVEKKKPRKQRKSERIRTAKERIHEDQKTVFKNYLSMLKRHITLHKDQRSFSISKHAVQWFRYPEGFLKAAWEDESASWWQQACQKVARDRKRSSSSQETYDYVVRALVLATGEESIKDFACEDKKKLELLMKWGYRLLGFGKERVVMTRGAKAEADQNLNTGSARPYVSTRFAHASTPQKQFQQQHPSTTNTEAVEAKPQASSEGKKIICFKCYKEGHTRHVCPN